MKIAIFGHARSGSTMLYYILEQHLLAAGLIEEWAGISEAFNPHRNRLLICNPQGHLENIILGSSLPTRQFREERVELFNKHLNDDYLIKVMSHDTTCTSVIDTVVDNYTIIAVERKNVISACLSGLIAFHHSIWNVQDNTQPKYEPFVATTEELQLIGLGISRYYYWRDKLNPQAIVYYEDMATQTTEDTLRQTGLYQGGVPTNDTPTRKLLSFEEKTKLILNLDEALDHFYGIISAYGIDIEHNEL